MHEPELLHAVADLLCHALGLVGHTVLQDDREFVAPQAGQRVARTHGFAQQLGHLLQKLVAHRVAAGIINELELVQVDI